MTFIHLYKQEDNYITCYNIQTTKNFNDNDLISLKSLFNPNIENINHKQYTEIGPHLHIITPWSSNCQNILEKMGVRNVTRVEKTYLKEYGEEIDPLMEIIYENKLMDFNFNGSDKNDFYDVENMEEENERMGLGFDQFDLDYYGQLFKKLGRNPTSVELFDLSQSNSEHARHWFFKGKLDGKDKTLFQMVKDTQKHTNDKSLVAFHDNSSVFKGYNIDLFCPDYDNHQFKTTKKKYHFTFTSETHNFPTSICPFQGANTGTGGRIRDNQCVGRGGMVIAGIAGYCVGELKDSKYAKKNLKTLIEASDGASDYGNKFGEPVVLGFMRTFEMDNVGWIKPIMFTGGMGQISENNVEKIKPEKDMLVMKIGGPAFRIGFGGGAASSRDQNTKNYKDDLDAVQRGDPEMENRMNRFIRQCIEMEENPIQNINDQGAGGTANVTKEIVYPMGADICLDNIIKSDSSMTALELWVSEYQENNTILINEKDENLIREIAHREQVPVSVIGKVNKTGKIKVSYKDQIVMHMPLEPIVGKMPKKSYKLDKVVSNYPKINIGEIDILEALKKVLSLPTVGSKRFLVNKVDRSVTGLVAQQQCVGPLHTPLSNYSITAQSYFNKTGVVTSIGEQPIKSLVNPNKMARMSLGEMLTNMVFAGITNLIDVRFSANWMWPLSFEGEKYNLYRACKSMCKMANQLHIASDRGKDSLSMSYKDKDGIVKCPPSLVITGYAPTENINVKVTPDFKKHGSSIYYISFNGKFRLGTSSLAYSMGQIGSDDDCPDVDDVKNVECVFNMIQKLVSEGVILSGHDASDGGLITTLCEMAFSGNMGFRIGVQSNVLEFCFNEELGLVIEIDRENKDKIEGIFNHLYYLGSTVEENVIEIIDVFREEMTVLRKCWEKNSYEMELLQRNKDCVEEEYEEYDKMQVNVPYRKFQEMECSIELPLDTKKHKIAIIRDEGTNGDKELSFAFYMAGFDVYDLCINDFLINDDLTLEEFRGIAFAGGFSYSDVCGAGQGYACVIKNNKRINDVFNNFKNRTDTFSLGICNGCQLMSVLEWVPCKMIDNKSGKFESRCPFVKINKSNAIMLKDMEGITLPVWVAHGEGQFVANNDNIAIQYVDNTDSITEKYPYNPNGSENGVAGMCSIDGRHLAMMPHPERSVLGWQLPYHNNNQYTFWLQMFINAYKWCDTNI